MLCREFFVIVGKILQLGVTGICNEMSYGSVGD
jgi:hypothetical protein